MNYKQKTKFFGIPVPGYGDHIWPELEIRKYQILENMLIAGTNGVQNCVFDDGDFSLAPDDAGKYTVSLRANGQQPSAKGLVGGAYFQAVPLIEWTGLEKGSQYLLWLTGTAETFADCTLVRPVSSKYGLEGAYVLLATVDLSGETPVLNPEPDGKVYSEDLAKHIMDFQNPHGVHLVQDTLTVKEKLVLPESIEIGGSAVSADDFMASAAELTGKRVKIIDFTSPGPSGLVLLVPDAVAVQFVMVERVFNSEMKDKVLGEVMTGYFGIDPMVETANGFSVYNSGDSGLPMRALAICSR